MNQDNTLRQWVADIRTDLHRHPELSGQEVRTTRQIIRILEGLGIETRGFDDLTGAVGLIRGRAQGPCLALRADIDALPLMETEGRPHGSTIPGIMHACGHDAHTAILLGVARKIMDTGLCDRICGSVKLLFQPSEEKLGGSLMMIRQGVLEDPHVDRIIAGHMDPNLPAGHVGVFTRLGHAASLPFTLTIKGRGAHGARPHKGINPITAGAVFVSALDGIIQRHVPPTHTGVVSVGSFKAGRAGNVIPETAVLKGTIRTHDAEMEKRIKQALENHAQGVGTMFNAQCCLEFGKGAPLGLNDPETCRDLRRAAEKVVGKGNTHVLPFIMGSEDFYYFTRERPGAMMRIGCGPASGEPAQALHNPGFDIDEKALAVGTDVLFTTVADFFDLK